MTISTRVYNDQAMSTLNRITGDIQEIQSRIATGRNILKASDSPGCGGQDFLYQGPKSASGTI